MCHHQVEFSQSRARNWFSSLRVNVFTVLPAPFMSLLGKLPDSWTFEADDRCLHICVLGLCSAKPIFICFFAALDETAVYWHLPEKPSTLFGGFIWILLIVAILSLEEHIHNCINGVSRSNGESDELHNLVLYINSRIKWTLFRLGPNKPYRLRVS